MPKPKSPHIFQERSGVSREAREQERGHRGVTLWFTGLSGSGKSTLAREVERRLHERACVCYGLDGDNIRHGLNQDLGFSPEDRRENIRRIGEVARLFTDAGVMALCAFISPYRADRDALRALLGEGNFVEIHVSTPLEVCEARDTKGLYKRARAGEIDDFTGIGAPYEAPLQPELAVDTSELALAESAETVLGFLEENGYIR